MTKLGGEFCREKFDRAVPHFIFPIAYIFRQDEDMAAALLRALLGRAAVLQAQRGMLQHCAHLTARVVPDNSRLPVPATGRDACRRNKSHSR